MTGSIPTNWVAPEAKPGFPEGHQMYRHPHDTKKVDDKGNPIVLGKPWSEVATDLWLNVLVFKGATSIRLDRRWTGRNIRLPFPQDVWIHISATRGKPVADQPTWGGCLEIPADLGDDKLKQQYVTEWFICTVREAMVLAGYPPRFSAKDRLEMTEAVEDALRGQGL